MAVSIAIKLYRLTKLGHEIVKEALKSFEGISDFAIAKHQHRQNFTKFHDGGGVKRDTAETYFDSLEIPNWHEDWDKIIELVTDAIADWKVYDDRWVGRKKLVRSLTDVTWNPHAPDPSPAGEGEQNLIIFLFPSPAGEGLGVKALETSTRNISN